MVKFNEVKLTYNCPAAPPINIYMDRVYSIGKDNKGFFFTDGNYIEYVKESDLWYIKMLFTPNNAKWEDVEFKEEEIKAKEEIKPIKTFDNTLK